MTKEAKRYSFFATVSSLFAIATAVLFFVQALSYLNVYMAVNYVTYFVGLALVFTAMYCREKEYRKTKNFCFLLGAIFIIVALVLLVYGFTSGNIPFDFSFSL